MSRIAATSQEAKMLEIGVAALAGCVAFQTLVGAQSAGAALAHIVEAWGGHQAENAAANTARAADDAGTTLTFPCSHGHVSLGDLSITETAHRSIWRTGRLEWTIYMARETGHTPADSYRHILNTAGVICDEIRAKIGAETSYPAGGDGGPSIEDILIPERESIWKDYLIAVIAVQWRS